MPRLRDTLDLKSVPNPSSKIIKSPFEKGERIRTQVSPLPPFSKRRVKKPLI